MGKGRWDRLGANVNSRHNIFFFSSRRRHTRLTCDWSSDVCSSDLRAEATAPTWSCSTSCCPTWRAGTSRSEERRVGKECRFRWYQQHCKKDNKMNNLLSQEAKMGTVMRDALFASLYLRSTLSSIAR